MGKTCGTFGNIRVKNRLVEPKEGSFTRKFPEGEEMFIYDAAMNYQAEGTSLLTLGGKEYRSGEKSSCRDFPPHNCHRWSSVQDVLFRL